MPLLRLRGVLRSRFPIFDGVELLEELLGHEVDSREVVDNALEDADGIPDMHPFQAIEA
jgi:hypothetical protein